MAAKVRPVRAATPPPGNLIRTGDGNRGYRFESGSIGAWQTIEPPPTRFEAAPELTAEQIAERERAAGIEPEGVPPAAGYAPVGRPIEDPANWNALQPGPVQLVSSPRRAPVTDLSGLPQRFTLDVERKENGWWVVRSPALHAGIFVAREDICDALAEAPGIIAEILRLDGEQPAKRRRAKK